MLDVYSITDKRPPKKSIHRCTDKCMNFDDDTHAFQIIHFFNLTFLILIFNVLKDESFGSLIPFVNLHQTESETKQAIHSKILENQI